MYIQMLVDNLPDILRTMWWGGKVSNNHSFGAALHLLTQVVVEQAEELQKLKSKVAELETKLQNGGCE